MTFNKLSFTDCNFNQQLRINKCKIIDDFLLNNYTINKKSSLSESVFCNDFIIHETTFNESINLSNISIGSIFNIATSSINKLTFSNIKFLQNKSTEIKLYDYKIYFNKFRKTA